MSPVKDADAIRDLLDREAIRDVLHRSALANDTCDREMWKSTYWPDGFEDHGNFRGNAHTFIDVIAPLVTTTMDATWHHIGNVVIRIVSPTEALVHSYAFVYCRMVGEGSQRWDLLAGVRYIDRFEKRAGEWRIRERITKTDWMREAPDSLDWSRPDPQTGVPMPLGMRAASDPLHSLFPGGDLAPLRTGIGS